MVLSLDKISLRHKMYIFALVAVLVLWCATVLVFLPQHERLAAVRAEYQQERQQVQVIEAFSLDHPDVEAYLAELDQKQLLINRMLPETTGIGEYLGQLETAAKQSGVILTQVKPGQPVDKGGYMETQLEVLVRGSFFQTLNFFKKLDEGQRFSAIGTASLHSKQGMLDSKLVVSIYSMKK